jgi:hypothetical protein
MGRLNKTDWEGLAKNLQEALAREMKENERLGQEIEELNDELESYVESLSRARAESLDHRSGAGDKDAIIRYLEKKLADEMAKNRRFDDIPF